MVSVVTAVLCGCVFGVQWVSVGGGVGGGSNPRANLPFQTCNFYFILFVHFGDGIWRRQCLLCCSLKKAGLDITILLLFLAIVDFVILHFQGSR